MDKLICNNKKAYYDFFIDKEIECGLVLKVSEVKSIVSGKCNITGSYIDIFDNELFVLGMNIPNIGNDLLSRHDEKANRKLLAHKKEILEYEQWIQNKGNTIVPLKVYVKNGKIKIMIGLARGKKNYDKRETIKQKDIAREIQQNYKNTLR